MFTLSTTDIVVPAGGQVGVDLTVNTALPAAEGGVRRAHVLATGGTVQVATPVAVDRRGRKSYDLTLRPIDGFGTPTDLDFSFVFGVDRQRFRPVPTIGRHGHAAGPQRASTTWMPRSAPRARTDCSTPARVVHPTVDVSSDTTVVLDARKSQADRDKLRPGRDCAIGVVGGRGTAGSPRTGALFTGVLGDSFDRIQIGAGRGSRAPPGTGRGHQWHVGRFPDATGDVSRSTVTYNLAWFDYRPGCRPGFARHVVDSDLAEVDTPTARSRNGKRGTKVWVAREARARGVRWAGLRVPASP